MYLGIFLGVLCVFSSPSLESELEVLLLLRLAAAAVAAVAVVGLW